MDPMRLRTCANVSPISPAADQGPSPMVNPFEKLNAIAAATARATKPPFAHSQIDDTDPRPAPDHQKECISDDQNN